MRRIDKMLLAAREMVKERNGAFLFAVVEPVTSGYFVLLSVRSQTDIQKDFSRLCEDKNTVENFITDIQKQYSIDQHQTRTVCAWLDYGKECKND